jgi:glycosyltransferase involved in cell wall biosynthesis
MTESRLSIVIPALNEESGIAGALRQIRAHALETGLSFQLIVVDDGSTDATWRVLQELQTEIGELRAVRFSRNLGKEQRLPLVSISLRVTGSSSWTPICSIRPT